MGSSASWGLRFRLVLYRVRAHFAHTQFLRFLFLAPADLLLFFRLQWRTRVSMNPKTR